MEPDDSPPRPVPILDYLYGTHNTFHNGKCVLNGSQTFRTDRVTNSFTRVKCRSTTNWVRRHSCTGHRHDVLEISYVCLCSAGYSMERQNNGCKWIQTGITTPRTINTDLRIKNHNLGCENHNLGCEFLINKNLLACWSIFLLFFGIWSNQKDYRTTGVMLLYITAYWDRNTQLSDA
jgi:hypothetical protein